MKEKEEEYGELSFGQREVTIRDFQDEPKPKTKRETFNDKFIKREGGSFARRGTATAQRAEIKEKAKNRAKQAALKRRNK